MEGLEAALAGAKQALARGDGAAAQEAASLLAPYAAQSEHPHVPFLLGAALQRQGLLPAARSAYERALALEPALIHARLNLVHVLVALQQLDEAQAHAEEAVAREPLSAERQFLLALVYTEARQEASARKALQRCVALDPRCVEAYVNLDALYLRAGDLKACRALASMATREARLSGGTFRFWTHPAQRPPHMVQGLRASPFWSSAELPWCAELEANAHVICEELAQLERNAQAPWGAVGGRAAHDGSLVSSGTWSEFLLLGAGAASNAALCPRTTALLQRITAATSLARCGVGEALFSALAPGTRLRPHCGATNSRLTCHLGLRVPADCGLRVGDETRGWEAGKCTVFDDSFEHEAWNEGDAVRVVLLINFWHPDIPPSDWRPLQTPAAAGV